MASQTIVSRPSKLLSLDEVEIRHVIGGQVYAGAACPTCREARAPKRAVWDYLADRYGLVYRIIKLEPMLRCRRCGSGAGIKWWIAHPHDGANPFREA